MPDVPVSGIFSKLLESGPVVLVLLLGAYVLVKHIIYLQGVIKTKDEQILAIVNASHASLADQTSAITSIRELLAEMRGADKVAAQIQPRLPESRS